MDCQWTPDGEFYPVASAIDRHHDVVLEQLWITAHVDRVPHESVSDARLVQRLTPVRPRLRQKDLIQNLCSSVAYAGREWSAKRGSASRSRWPIPFASDGVGSQVAAIEAHTGATRQSSPCRPTYILWLDSRQLGPNCFPTPGKRRAAPLFIGLPGVFCGESS
jgi:hypothetical protein